jgi:hypothetical protein
MSKSGRTRTIFRERLFGLGKTRQKSSLLAPSDWSRECSTMFCRLNGLTRFNATEWRRYTPRAAPHGAARPVRGPPRFAKKAHATDELSQGTMRRSASAGVGGRPVARVRRECSLGSSVFREPRHRMALEHNLRGASQRPAVNSRHAAKLAHATDPHGELRGEVPSAGVGVRPVARGRTRGMAVAVGDWRTRPAQTLGKPPNLPGATRRRTANSGPATLCEQHPSDRTRRGATRLIIRRRRGGAPLRVVLSRCLNSRFRGFGGDSSQIATWHQSLPLQPRLQAWGG